MRYNIREVISVEDRLLTPEQVAARLAVSPKSIREWLKSQKLKGTKMGRLWRVREDDLRKFLDTESETQPRVSASTVRGMFANSSRTVEDFLREKYEDVEREERKFEQRHRK